MSAELDGPARPGAYRDCGPEARPEPGLQGQIPMGAQRNGDSAKGYQSNVRWVSADPVGLRGQSFQLAWYEDCAYVSTIGVQAYTGALGEPQPELDGMAVIDAADPRDPPMVDVVKSPVGKSKHEALEARGRPGRGGLPSRLQLMGFPPQ